MPFLWECYIIVCDLVCRTCHVWALDKNRCGDKQNKNRWDLQTVNTTRKIDAAVNTNRCGGKHKTDLYTKGHLWFEINTQLLFGISIISNNKPSAFQQGCLVIYFG